MESCASTCQRLAPGEAPEVAAEVVEAAESLACLLTDRAEFQNFLRLARAVRLDQDVAEILSQMNEYPAPGGDGSAAPDEALEDRLEALPVVRGYRAAEQSARATFTAVEQAISAAAGVAFAENAKASACG